MIQSYASNGKRENVRPEVIDVRDATRSVSIPAGGIADAMRQPESEGVRAVIVVASDSPPSKGAWCSLAPAAFEMLADDAALVSARTFAQVRHAAGELSRALASPDEGGDRDHRIGIGGVLDERRSIDDSAGEARRATALATTAGLTRNVIAYDNVFLVDAVTSDSRLQNRLVRILQPVVAHDRAKRQHLVRTLEQFFDSDLSTSTTARKLGTHRHTIDYRLRKIEELLGFELADYPNRQLIEIALLALRMQRNRASAMR